MDLKLWLKERELNARQIASRKTIADRSVWIEDANYFNAAYDAIQRAELQGQKPIDMVLHCPACGMQHVDAPDERTPGWVNEPHRSHLCHDCGHVWRPSDVPTNGVAAVKTKGKADSPVAQAPNAQQAEPKTLESGGIKTAQQAEPRDAHFGGSSYEASMLRNLLARIHGDGGHYVAQHGLEKAMEDADQLCAKWRAQQAEAQEPVATINISDDDFGIGLTDDYAFGVKRLPNGKHLLFTRPQPAQRPPLTIAEVEQILARWNYELHGDRSRFIARETELAHGIGFAK